MGVGGQGWGVLVPSCPGWLVFMHTRSTSLPCWNLGCLYFCLGGWSGFEVFSFACQLPLVVVGAVREHGLDIVIWDFSKSFLCLLWFDLRWFPYIGCSLLLCSIYYCYYYFSV